MERRARCKPATCCTCASAGIAITGTLGITLREISLLLQADPHVFARKETLEQDGSWSLLKDLEVKGFVEIHESHTLPDGDAKMLGVSVVQYRASVKGRAVVAAINTK